MVQIGNYPGMYLYSSFSDGISIEGIASRFSPNSEHTASALKELERHDVLR